VQRNRAVPRGANGAQLAQPVPAAIDRPRIEPPVPVVSPRVPAAAAPAPAAAPAAISMPGQPARAKPAPTPLEMALEGRASRQPERPPPAAEAAPITFAPPAPQGGRVLAEPVTAEPTKPIVQVVSKQPPHAAASFGELLRRSLSLRPR
jgi:hypothetical protein